MRKVFEISRELFKYISIFLYLLFTLTKNIFVLKNKKNGIF